MDKSDDEDKSTGVTDASDKPQHKQETGDDQDSDEELSPDEADFIALPARVSLVRYFVMVTVAITWISFIIACGVTTYLGVISKPILDPSRFFYAGCYIGMTSCIVGFGGAEDIHKQTLWIYCALLSLALCLTLCGIIGTGGVIIHGSQKNDTSVWLVDPERFRRSYIVTTNETYFEGYVPNIRHQKKKSGLTSLITSRKAAAIDYDHRMWKEFSDPAVMTNMTITLIVFQVVALLLGVCLLKFSGDDWWVLWRIDM